MSKLPEGHTVTTVSSIERIMDERDKVRHRLDVIEGELIGQLLKSGMTDCFTVNYRKIERLIQRGMI